MIIAASEASLRSAVVVQDDKFESIFEEIQNPQKASWRTFLLYIHNVLREYDNYSSEDGVSFVHLHLPFSEETFKEALLEYIIIRSFNVGLSNDQVQDSYVAQRSKIFERKLGNMQIPDKASGVKGNREYKRWAGERERIREALNFLKRPVLTGKSLRPETILNLPSNDYDTLMDRRINEGHFISLDQIKEGQLSYTLLNPDHSSDEIIQALHDAGKLSNIKSIILFDCEGKRIFKGFNARYIKELREYDIPVQSLVLFSFEKRDFRLRTAINRQHQIYSNFFFLDKKMSFKRSYLFQKEEMCLLSGQQKGVEPYLGWIGEQSETFKDYLETTKELGLHKLRSIPILNTYSFCFNRKISEMILAGLFEETPIYEIVDSETKSALNDLESYEREPLKNAILMILDNVIQGWDRIKNEIIEAQSGGSVAIVVPHQASSNDVIVKELKSLVRRTFKLYTWNDIKEVKIKEQTIIVLAYRDVGIPPFDIYPNIIENRISEDRIIRLIFFKDFFLERYRNSLYRYLTSYNSLISNRFRQKYLQWEEIDRKIDSLKISDAGELVDSDDSEYGIKVQTDSIRIEFVDTSHTSVFQSRLFVAKKRGKERHQVIRADDLLTDTDASEYLIQPLEELHEELNLFEITPEEENELRGINEMYGLLGHDQNQALWKVELNRRLDQHDGNVEILYKIIEAVTGNDGKLIKYPYFRDYWLDVQSTILIPRRTKHFRLICKYLELPPEYYRLKLKQRASLTSNSRQSNSQMTALLADMISKGLFEDNVDWDKADLVSFLEDHDLEEKGIVKENARREMGVLVHLIKGEMRLKQISKITVA